MAREARLGRCWRSGHSIDRSRAFRCKAAAIQSPHGQPTALIIDGHVAQWFAHQAGVLARVVLADRQVSLGFVFGFNQLDAHSIPKRLLSSVRLLRWFPHPPVQCYPKTNFAHNRTLPSPSVTFPSELMQPWSKLGPINCEGWVICLFEQSPVPEDSFGVYRSIPFKLSGEAAIKRLRSGLLENLLPR